MMKKLSLFGIFLLLLIFSTSVFAQERDIDSKLLNSWEVFEDPRFDFSISYPSNYAVIPRDDTKEGVSGIVTFTSNPELGKEEEIVVGHLLIEFDESQVTSIEEWAVLYEEVSTSFDENEIIHGQSTRIERSINESNTRREGVKIPGSSPLLDNYKTAYFPHGETVWFIWTNKGDSQVYDALVESFNIGENMPTTLREIYGENFHPLNLENALREKRNPQRNPNSNKESQIISQSLTMASNVHKGRALRRNSSRVNALIPSSFWSPVKGSYSVLCGSSYHNWNYGSYYAADVQTPMWTPLYSAQNGTVTFAGWDTTGYGLLTKIDHYGKVAYYAHQSMINALYNGAYVWRDQKIGWSGASGNGGLYGHLHFHIEWNTTLVGMYGFTAYNNSNGSYPTWGTCGVMGR